MTRGGVRKKKLSGAQRRCLRQAMGLPRYTAQEAVARRERSIRRTKARYAENISRITAIKLERGCADCGYRLHPHALEFDHLPEYEKTAEVAHLAWSAGTWGRIAAEIAKCEVVCANCHAIRTTERNQRGPRALRAGLSAQLDFGL